MAKGLDRQWYVFFAGLGVVVVITGLLVFLLTGSGDETAINVGGIPPPGDADVPPPPPAAVQMASPGDADFGSDSTIPVLVEVSPEELDAETFDYEFDRAMQRIAQEPGWAAETVDRCEEARAPCKCFWQGLQKGEKIFAKSRRTGEIMNEDGSLGETTHLLQSWYREFARLCPNEKNPATVRKKIDTLQAKREEAVRAYLSSRGATEFAEARDLIADGDLRAVDALEICTGLAPHLCDCHKALGLALARRGDRGNAEARLEYYLSKCPSKGGKVTVKSLLEQADNPPSMEDPAPEEAVDASPETEAEAAPPSKKRKKRKSKGKRKRKGKKK